MRPTGDLMTEHRAIERMLKVVSKAADMLDLGQQVDQEVFTSAADFFRNFADKCHHGKEEKQLFVKLVERGLSGEVGPIAVLLREHEDGRAHVRKISEFSTGVLTDKARQGLVKNVRGYNDLLRPHIQKEDGILFPMANWMLTPEDQSELEIGFERIEEDVMGPGVHEHYNKMIEDFETRLG